MRHWTILLGATMVDIGAADLAVSARGHDMPDPVHSRTIKRHVRRQQREQAKRLARMQKGPK